MTIDEIMLRDIADEKRKRRERREAEERAGDYDAEVSRRLWRRRLKCICEIFFGVITLALFALLLWILLVATPCQMSAECDLARAEMEAAERNQSTNVIECADTENK